MNPGAGRIASGRQHDARLSDDWSSSIVGQRILGRRCVALDYICFSQIADFLLDETECRKGVLWCSTPGHAKPVSGIGSASRLVDLEELVIRARLSPGFRLCWRDLVFAPYDGRQPIRTTSIRKLYLWAVAHRAPYIFQHDNDTAWFSAFGSRVERRLFCRFLSYSTVSLPPECLDLTPESWRVIRRGLYAHGWTLHRRSCSYVDGVAQYVLWGGVRRCTVIGSNEKWLLSRTSRKLVIVRRGSGPMAAQVSAEPCPLGDDYAALSPPKPKAPGLRY